MRVYLGYDSRERAAYKVAEASILRRALHDVEVLPISHPPARPVDRRDGKLWCPISQAPMATEFAIGRFQVPLLQDSGWAVFLDCDVVVFTDIREILNHADDNMAVCVVKHNYIPAQSIKMDGQEQTTYARKNWSSVILWNCSHPAHKQLRGIINSWPGRDLHAFKWLRDFEIGELPLEWNMLVGVTNCKNPKILHYTLGGPWLPNWKGGPLDEVWREEAALCSK